MRSCIKKWNHHHHHPAPFSGLAFPAIILHNNSLFSCLNHSPKMASSKAITDFFPPAKRSKGVAASVAPSSFDPSFKRSFISVPPKPTTTGSAPFTPPESTDDDVSTAVQPSSSSNLTAEQKLRVQFKQSLAKAKRNLRICTERVSKSTSGLKLEQLLVEETWLKALPGEFEKPYAKKLSEFVESEIQSPIPIYPPQHLIFNALNSTPFDKVKAVVIGQDPYHGPGQAMGLSFSVPEGIKVPSSLINIYKELQQDLDCSIPSHGNLERWAVQGVLLLNAVLTGTTLQSGNHFNWVEMHQANSHAKKGWEQFTDSVIEAISKKRTGIVFLLWGNYAQAKSRLIDESKHHILKAAHPSGLSAHKGFFGCRHFSRTNLILEKADTTPIDWQL